MDSDDVLEDEDVQVEDNPSKRARIEYVYKSISHQAYLLIMECVLGSCIPYVIWR